jgi:hypothetical protein
MSIGLAAIGAGIISAGQKKAHPLTYAREAYATIEARAEKVGFEIA